MRKSHIFDPTPNVFDFKGFGMALLNFRTSHQMKRQDLSSRYQLSDEELANFEYGIIPIPIVLAERMTYDLERGLSLFEFINKYRLGYSFLHFHEEALPYVRPQQVDLSERVAFLEGKLKQAVTKCQYLQGQLNTANEMVHAVTNELLEKRNRIEVLEEERATKGARIFIQTASKMKEFSEEDDAPF